MKIAFVGNQGGRDVIAVYADMVRTLEDEFGAEARFAVWLDREKTIPAEYGAAQAEISSFEEYVRAMPVPDGAVVRGLARKYREVCWSEVVAAERAFSDYSMLLGAAGERQEGSEYVQRLVVAIVGYLEQVLTGCAAVVCQTADTLFSLAVFKVARHLGVPAFAISPAWLLEPGKGGGFFANSEYLECRRMTRAFERRRGTALLDEERSRTDALIDSIRGFSGKTAFHATTSKGKSAGRNALSPNWRRLPAYWAENSRRNKHVEYVKIDPARKLRANLLRVFRKISASHAYGLADAGRIPQRSVFYALHYQPEQSTLAQGIWHVNQVALVENLSKSLPLGHTLVVKEHPWGRGNRPRWQYAHMASFHNVLFCDAPAKEIIQRVDAVVAVSGTVAMEALAFDKPTVILGRNFFEFSDLFYRVRDIQDLPETLARILIDGDYARQTDREERLHRFLMAYLDGLVPCFPLRGKMAEWGRVLAEELRLDPLSKEGGAN